MNVTLTRLVRANMASDIKADQRMSDEEVLAQIPLFVGDILCLISLLTFQLFAGNTTIAVTLTSAVGQLAKYPYIQQHLREEALFLEEERPSWRVEPIDSPSKLTLAGTH